MQKKQAGACCSKYQYCETHSWTRCEEDV